MLIAARRYLPWACKGDLWLTLCLVTAGPNMGGKSTLLRQVCLAAVIAQVCDRYARPRCCEPAWIPMPRLTPSVLLWSKMLEHMSKCSHTRRRRARGMKAFLFSMGRSGLASGMGGGGDGAGGWVGTSSFPAPHSGRRGVCEDGGEGPHHGGRVHLLCGAHGNVRHAAGAPPGLLPRSCLVPCNAESELRLFSAVLVFYHGLK